MNARTKTGCRKRPNATLLTSASTATGVARVSKPTINANSMTIQMSDHSGLRRAISRSNGVAAFRPDQAMGWGLKATHRSESAAICFGNSRRCIHFGSVETLGRNTSRRLFFALSTAIHSPDSGSRTTTRAPLVASCCSSSRVRSTGRPCNPKLLAASLIQRHHCFSSGPAHARVASISPRCTAVRSTLRISLAR